MFICFFIIISLNYLNFHFLILFPLSDGPLNLKQKIMHIFINDVATECPENSTILQVLTQQDISPLNIAIALDNTVVPKAQWETTLVRDGSQLLIIKAVQGG